MHLINFPPVRVQKYPQGYSVEIEKKTWYGKKYWVHIISYYGRPDKPYYYLDFDMAVKEAKRMFSWDIISQSPK